jgi:outer membrane protein assembly factor BamE (lipoprotein component of BamABCDE complex)
MIKNILAILTLFGLCACASMTDKADKLATGMSQDEVLGIMGEPSKKLDKQWYYAGSYDLILNFDESGKYQSYETTKPAPKAKTEPDSYQKRIDQIQKEERERSISDPDSTRSYQ